MKTGKFICPACHLRQGVPILYGMPTPEASALVEHGMLALGGCCMEHDAPERHCTGCGHEWRIKRRVRM